MKKILLAILIYSTTQSLFPQTITDSVFNDVIRIDNENVTTNNFDYILNIPLEIVDKKP